MALRNASGSGRSSRASVRCGEKSRFSRAMPHFSIAPSISAASVFKFDDAAMPAQKTRGFFSLGKNPKPRNSRSEEHTSELQSRLHLVCRLLLEKKKLRSRPAPERGH